MTNGKTVAGIGGVIMGVGALVTALAQPLVGVPLSVLGLVVVGCGLAKIRPSLPTAINTPETADPKPIKPQEVQARWRQFLGPKPYSHKHPRTGEIDPTRLVSADGKRSIRYGDHERNSGATKHHFHEETWTLDKTAHTMTIDNQMVRVPLGQKNPDPAAVQALKDNIAQIFRDESQ